MTDVQGQLRAVVYECKAPENVSRKGNLTSSECRYVTWFVLMLMNTHFNFMWSRYWTRAAFSEGRSECLAYSMLDGAKHSRLLIFLFSWRWQVGGDLPLSSGNSSKCLNPDTLRECTDFSCFTFGRMRSTESVSWRLECSHLKTQTKY